MVKSEVKIINGLGLHARAAAGLVRLAEKYKSTVKLHRSDNSSKSADAKSILSILSLAAAKGTVLIVEVEGEDEQQALAAVEEIFANGFGEL
jgi:phosphocarrier protein HPr